MQGPQINRFGCGEIRLAGLQFAFNIAALDPDKELTGLNTRAGLD